LQGHHWLDLIEGAVIKKPGKWEIIVMAVGAIATVSSLVWMKNQSDMHALRHEEVMFEIESLKSGIGPAAPVARELLAATNADNRAVLQLLSPEIKNQKAGLAYLEKNWSAHDAAKLVEILPFLGAGSGEREPVLKLLNQKTGKAVGKNLAADRSYLDFKALLYHRCDPRFIHYFAGGPKVTIDPEEVRWSGVTQSPALRHTALIEAGQATYLNESDLVFGITSANESVAYPQRLLVWHSLVESQWEAGGGTRALLIVYDSSSHMAQIFESADGADNFSQSGFVYRGEPLIVSDSKASLWWPKTGKTVISRQSDLELKPLPVVATTWAAWKSAHRQTKVLSNDTGFDRNYF